MKKILISLLFIQIIFSQNDLYCQLTQQSELQPCLQRCITEQCTRLDIRGMNGLNLSLLEQKIPEMTELKIFGIYLTGQRNFYYDSMMTGIHNNNSIEEIWMDLNICEIEDISFFNIGFNSSLRILKINLQQNKFEDLNNIENMLKDVHFLEEIKLNIAYNFIKNFNGLSSIFKPYQNEGYTILVIELKSDFQKYQMDAQVIQEMVEYTQNSLTALQLYMEGQVLNSQNQYVPNIINTKVLNFSSSKALKIFNVKTSDDPQNYLYCIKTNSDLILVSISIFRTDDYVIQNNELITFDFSGFTRYDSMKMFSFITVKMEINAPDFLDFFPLIEHVEEVSFGIVESNLSDISFLQKLFIYNKQINNVSLFLYQNKISNFQNLTRILYSQVQIKKFLLNFSENLITDLSSLALITRNLKSEVFVCEMRGNNLSIVNPGQMFYNGQLTSMFYLGLSFSNVSKIQDQAILTPRYLETQFIMDFSNNDFTSFSEVYKLIQGIYAPYIEIFGYVNNLQDIKGLDSYCNEYNGNLTNPMFYFFFQAQKQNTDISAIEKIKFQDYLTYLVIYVQTNDLSPFNSFVYYNKQYVKQLYVQSGQCDDKIYMSQDYQNDGRYYFEGQTCRDVQCFNVNSTCQNCSQNSQKGECTNCIYGYHGNKCSQSQGFLSYY